MQIAIVFGGNTIESEYSKKSAYNLKRCLDEYQYKIIMVNISESTWIYALTSNDIDLVIDLVYGCPGQEGIIKGLLRILNIKHLGSDIFTHTLIKDKYLAKLVCRNNGIDTPDFCIITQEQYCNSKNECLDYSIKQIGLPSVVKPRKLGGLSLGISFCDTKETFEAACENSFIYDKNILVEKYIKGIEVSVCVVEINSVPTVLSPLMISIPKTAFICDYNTKINGNRMVSTKEPVLKKYEAELKDISLKLFSIFEVKDFCYFDFIISDKIYFIEAGVTPGLTENSNLSHSLGCCGLNISELFVNLISNKGD